MNKKNNSKINRYKPCPKSYCRRQQDLRQVRHSAKAEALQYLLADAAYDTDKNKKFLINKGYIPVIRYNKRNTKDKKKIKQNTMKGKYKLIYKNRRIIESFFAWIKNYPVINQNYQKTIPSYDGLFSLACSLIISKRI